MKKRDQTIADIVAALNLYGDLNTPSVMRATVAALDDASLGVLHGISGVMRHAIAAKMPQKWITHIHGDLVEAFAHLTRVAHEEDAARN